MTQPDIKNLKRLLKEHPEVDMTEQQLVECHAFMSTMDLVGLNLQRGPQEGDYLTHYDDGLSSGMWPTVSESMKSDTRYQEKK